MANDTYRHSYTYDAALQLKDAGLVAASAAAQVGGSNKIIDVGLAFLSAVVVIQVSAIEIATGNEEYDIVLQGSNSSSFASGIENLAAIQLGATGSRDGSAIDSLVGSYRLPFFNVQNDVAYRYLRLYTVAAGTIASGINYTAFIGQAVDGN